jgi:hypothetical protein
MGGIVTSTPLKGFCNFWKESMQQLAERKLEDRKSISVGLSYDTYLRSAEPGMGVSGPCISHRRILHTHYIMDGEELSAICGGFKETCINTHTCRAGVTLDARKV